MALKPYAWEKTELTFVINRDANLGPDFEAGADLIRAQLKRWEFTGLSFREVESDADISFVDFDQAFDAFQPPYNRATAVEFVVDDQDDGIMNKSYVALDASRLSDDVSFAWLVSHSIGHVLGLEDDNTLDVLIGRRHTIMSYMDRQNPEPRGHDRAMLQERYGKSARDDAQQGSPYNDTLYGGEGDDTLYGGAAFDVLYGNQGADFLAGDGAADTLYGGQGNDTIAGDHEDVIYGNRGDDVIYGGAWAHGGQGDDLLFGDGGVVYGGVGADGFRLTNGAVAGDYRPWEGDYFF